MRLFNLLSTKYEEFDNTMKSFLSKAFGIYGQTYSVSNIYGMVLEAIKGVMQNIMFYIEDSMTEQNIFTATRKKSVYSLAKISGYDAYYGSPATGTVKLMTKITNGLDSGSTKLVIQDKTTITNQSTGYDYLLFLSNDYIVIDMQKPLIQEDIKIVQGKIERATYVAKGYKLESFEISPTGLFSTSYVEVYVNGSKQNIVSNIYDMTEDSNECVVSTGYDGGMSVVFGNGLHGKTLDEGDTIIVQYVVHDGTYGNVPITDTPIFKFKSNLKDGYGNDVNGNDYITISNSNYIVGGSNSDSISLVRNMIGTSSRALVISSNDNFKLFLSRFSFISVANIISYEKSLTISICPVSKIESITNNKTSYLTCPISSLCLTDYQKEILISALEESKKMFAGLSVQVIDPMFRKYAIICYVKIDSSYIREKAKTEIEESIINFFQSLEYNTTFIPKSSILSKVMNDVTGLTSFDMTIISNDDEEGKKNGYWYKYETRQVNKSIKIFKTRQTYDENEPVGLDGYGNIKVNSLLEIPIIHDGVKVWIDNNSSVTIRNGIEIHFI